MAILTRHAPDPTRSAGNPAAGAIAFVLRAMLGGVLLIGAAGVLAPEEASEEQVKAAFLVNFPKYVEWPADSFGATNSQIVLSVVGHREIAAELRKMIVGKSVNGRPLAVQEPVSLAELGPNCAVAFIGAGADDLAATLTRLKPCGVLTVGESDGFLELGGMIELARADRKVRLEVNLEAAREAGLRISSKLLSVATVVRGKPNPE